MTINFDSQIDKQLLIPTDGRAKKKKTKLEEAWGSITVSFKKSKRVSFKQQKTSSIIPSVGDQIDRLALKYLISREKLYDKYVKGPETFGAYLERKEQKYQGVIEQAIHDYKVIVAKYKSSRLTGNLSPIEPNGHAPNCLTEESLMKIVRKSVLKLSKVEGSHQTGVSFQVKVEKSWSILANREDGKLQIIKWCGNMAPEKSAKCLIGRGSFCCVHHIEDIANAQFSILKTIHLNSLEDERYIESSFLNEVGKLKYIHRKNIVDGVLEPPYCYFNIPINGFNFMGYIQKHYNLSDIIEAISTESVVPEMITKENGLMIMKKLYSALEMIHRSSKKEGCIIHGDIKSDNILIERTTDGKIRCVIGDFGAAKYTNLELKNLEEMVNEPLGTITTPGSFTETDWCKLGQALDKEDHELWIHYQKKRDLFGLTVAIWSLLTGYPPYDQIDSTSLELFPKTKKVYGVKIVESKYGRLISYGLQLALSEDPDYRPSARALIRAIDRELASIDSKNERVI